MRKLLFLLLAGLQSSFQAAEITLAENGNPKAAIVIQNNAKPIVRFAAKELSEHLQKMTGAQFAIGTEAGSDVNIYLGFGAGLAIFMFVGFVKSIPLEIEEAAAIDGCGPLRTFFSVVLPMLKPTLISVGILEIMWVWNDYLLPVLVLDINEFRTIPIHIQYLKGSYGTVDLGATMALILLSIIPVIIFYLACQKHIIKGVAAGAVKG